MNDEMLWRWKRGGQRAAFWANLGCVQDVVAVIEIKEDVVKI